MPRPKAKPRPTTPLRQGMPEKSPAEYYGKHPGGAPRTVSPPADVCKALGEEMVEWVRKNKPTHLSEWFSIEKMILWKEWNILIETKEFCPYYEQALSMVASNVRQGVIDKSLGQRFLSLYHRDMKHHEIEMKRLEAEATAKSVEVDAGLITSTMAVLDQLSKSQRRRKQAKDVAEADGDR